MRITATNTTVKRELQVVHLVELDDGPRYLTANRLVQVVGFKIWFTYDFDTEQWRTTVNTFTQFVRRDGVLEGAIRTHLANEKHIAWSVLQPAIDEAVAELPTPDATALLSAA
ncbi:hypothetical protein [Leifsonia sp. Leaf264]|uniref:hypothetical protein n=1 Tax=Leifsonia sp. Leaf264 TaxID=1736314 RepID=UPI0007016BAB|nr:hypothetical protein [Leifsonia sp. Leaf264]KQO98335.1 hypothetical protein ASF30_09755 [Leifsonia sp. Leaf264]